MGTKMPNVVQNNIPTISANNDEKNATNEDRENGCKNVKYYFTEYCQNTTFHGFKYVSDNQNRSILERIWWIFSISLSLYLCIVLILKTYQKWENSPVIVSFATEETPTWKVPFPTVTICPETKSLPKKFDYSKYSQMKKEGKVLSFEEETKFGLMSLLCSYHKKLNITAVYNGTDEEIYDFFDEVQPPFFDIISECKFMGEDYNCKDLFFPVITDDGICYTFNLISREQLLGKNVVHYKNYHIAPHTNWTLENGYPPNENKFTYPRRGLFAGAIFALEAKLSVYHDQLNYGCGECLQGFKIEVSHPSRLPRTRQQHFRIPLDQSVMAALSLDMMTTSEAVEGYSPKRRNCYFPHERHLRYFKLYAQLDCQIECKTNYTVQKCGCANFYMPRENTTRVCNGTDIPCIEKAEMELLFSNIESKINGDAQKLSVCDCLPLCTKLDYIVESSQSDWNWRDQYGNNSEKEHMSQFQIFFKRNQFITSQRNELFGPIDFLANLGGLLGLCVGFSLLSLTEIIYYISLRAVCNVRIFGISNWAGRTG